MRLTSLPDRFRADEPAMRASYAAPCADSAKCNRSSSQLNVAYVGARTQSQRRGGEPNRGVGASRCGWVLAACLAQAAESRGAGRLSGAARPRRAGGVEGATAVCPALVPQHLGAQPQPPSQEKLAVAMPAAGSAESSRRRVEQARAPAFRLEPEVPVSTMEPLGEGRTLIRMTAHRRLGTKIEQAQHLMRRQLPTGNVVEIFERALDLLIAERKKVLFGKSDRPRRRPQRRRSGSKPSRYVPRAVRREVAERDGEQCTFVSTDGHRCEERGRLELDHHPVLYSRGGESTPDNLRIRCTAHNQLAAEHAYGRAFMRERIMAARKRSTPSVTSHAPVSGGTHRSAGPKERSAPPVAPHVRYRATTDCTAGAPELSTPPVASCAPDRTSTDCTAGSPELSAPPVAPRAPDSATTDCTAGAPELSTPR